MQTFTLKSSAKVLKLQKIIKNGKRKIENSFSTLNFQFSFVLLTLGFSLLTLFSSAQIVTTLAGNGVQGSANGTGITASFYDPSGVATDGSGNLYVADAKNNEIRKIVISTGAVTTFAGSTASGNTNGTGTAASFKYPNGITYDGSGNLYVADASNNEIRKIVISSAAVTTLAGSTTAGSTNGTGTNATFNNPTGLVTDGNGNLFVADYNNNGIRRIIISSATVSTLAGIGTSGSANGTGTAAKFDYPTGVATDGTNVYVADASNNEIRQIVITSGVVTTLAGSTTSGTTNGTGAAASFTEPTGVVCDGSGNLYIAEYGYNEIRKIIITSALVSTYASYPSGGGNANGVGTAATFYEPYGVTTDASGNVYVADYGNNEIREIAPLVTPVAAFTASSTTICTGSYVSFTDNSTNYPSSWSWTFQGGTPATSTSENPTVYYYTAGTYSVSLTASNSAGNNTLNKTAYITVNATPTITASASAPTICSGSSTTLSVSGASTYSWNTGATTTSITVSPASTTSYSVNGNSAAGCPAGEQYVTITVNPTPTLSVSASPTAICMGNSATLTAGGASTYSWNTGATTSSMTISPPGTTTYTVNGSSAGCNAAAVTITETVNPIPPVSISGMTTICSQFGTILQADTGAASSPYSFMWNTSGTNDTIAISPASLAKNNNAVVSTLAGSAGLTGDANGTGSAATFNNPNGVATDMNGNVYVADLNNNEIRMIVASSGVVTTLAGSTASGNSNGTGTAASFSGPSGVTCDGMGNLFVSDGGNNEIRQIVISSGVVTTLAGTKTHGSADGTGSAAGFYSPQGITTDGSGNLYVADMVNNEIRKIVISNASVTTIAGSTTAGSVNGTGPGASFNQPNGITADRNGNLFVADNLNNQIRKIVISSGTVSTLAGSTTAGSANGIGTAAGFNGPQGISIDPGGNLYVGDGLNNEIRKIVVSTAEVITLAGTLTKGSANGTGPAAGFNLPAGVATDGRGNLYVADWNNEEIRKIALPDVYGVKVSLSDGCTNNATVSLTVNPSPALSIAPASPAICFGDSVVLNASGANTYQWDPVDIHTPSVTVSPTTSTTYYLIGSIGNCTDTALVTVKVDNAINVTVNCVNVTCNGLCNGSAVSTVTGGTSPYIYSWPSGGTNATDANLCAGTYTCIVTDSMGCKSLGTGTVNQPTPITISFASVNASCNGACNGSATSIVSGGTAPYTYYWSNGGTVGNLTGLCAGTYSLKVTDANGCSGLDSVTISQPPPLTVTITPTNATCGQCNGSANVSVGGGAAPYSYLWSNGGTTGNMTGFCAGTYSLTVTDANGCKAIDSVTISQSGIMTVTASAVNVTCNGLCNGSATANILGGAAPFTYTWDNGQTTQTATNLCAGKYTCIVTNGSGCKDTGSVTITQPAALSFNLSTVNGTCGQCNGSASCTVSSGTPPYTFSWNSGETTSSITNLCAGSCSVMVTDSGGCTANSGTVIIKTGKPISVTATGVDATCTGVCNGSATASVVGATPPIAYSWNSIPVQSNASATGLCVGSYTVTVTDSNKCTADASVSVGASGSLSVSVKVTSATCGNDNGSATATVSGGTPPFTYAWSNGDSLATADSLAAGIYNLTVIDNSGCSGSQSQSITVGDTNGPAVTVSSVTENKCYGGSAGAISVTVSGGKSPYQYSWSNGATTSNISGLPDGPYKLKVTDANGCSDFINTVTITSPAAIVISTTINPASCSTANGDVLVTASGGTSPYTYNWSTSSTSADLFNVSAGTYTVVVTDNNGCKDSADASVSNTSGPVITIESVTADSCTSGNTGSINISVTGGTPSYTYLWSDGATTQNVGGLGAGSYNVTVTDAGGCIGTANTQVLNSVPSGVSISIVSVDTESTHNIIVWNKSAMTGVDSLKLYYLNYLSVWQLIKTVPFSAPDYIVDSTPINNPNANTVRYCLTAIGTCGTEEPISASPWQNTTHIYQLTPGTFIWSGTGYLKEGVVLPVISYFLYRDSAGNGSWKAIDSVSGTQNTMNDYVYQANPGNYPHARWYIGAVLNDSIGAGTVVPILRPEKINNTTTRSNTQHNIALIQGVEQIASPAPAISVYPNPAGQNLNIKFNVAKAAIARVSIVDVMGRELYSMDNVRCTVYNAPFTINTGNLSQGVYFVKVTTNSSSQVVKFVKE
ncbi:MAG: T9SS type A sorting domain-containing protein [Bacteroidia bacterium]